MFQEGNFAAFWTELRKYFWGFGGFDVWFEGFEVKYCEFVSKRFKIDEYHCSLLSTKTVQTKKLCRYIILRHYKNHRIQASSRKLLKCDFSAVGINR